MIPDEIDLIVAEILDGTPLGRRWVEGQRARLELERVVTRLRNRGVPVHLLRELWFGGDVKSARALDGLTDAQLAEVGRDLC